MILGADISSLVHGDNKKKAILILCKDPTGEFQWYYTECREKIFDKRYWTAEEILFKGALPQSCAKYARKIFKFLTFPPPPKNILQKIVWNFEKGTGYR